MDKLIEQILSEMKIKNSTEISTDLSYKKCEEIKYKMWDEYKITIHQECKKLVISVWKK